ncbi:hypothetical protein FNF27_06189 [Cafeteria roenbergensis]|uniref:Uncharacterized protein n=2 Tax=Cafeteria roenbergensis TaxID=33653 RepID=A0A5A8E3K1_CAFRO|nr:hypothetical protein FNF27_06189 [Cafeteria roenbergensis]
MGASRAASVASGAEHGPAEAGPADATLSLRSAVHPGAIRHCVGALRSSCESLRPVFLFYCRLDDAANAGTMSVRSLTRLLRDIGALDDAVHPGAVHLQFVEALRSETESARGDEAEVEGVDHGSAGRAGRRRGGRGRRGSIGDDVRQSSRRRIRRRSVVQASGAGEALGLEGFLEVLVRVSELVREATQSALRARGAGAAVDVAAVRALEDAEEAALVGGRGMAGARLRRRQEEEDDRARRQLLGGTPRGSGDAPLTAHQLGEALRWARSFITRRVLPLGGLAAEEQRAVRALESDDVAAEARRARPILLLLYGEFATAPGVPGGGPELRLDDFLRLLRAVDVVPKLVGRRDAEVVFHGAARRGGTDAPTFYGQASQDLAPKVLRGALRGDTGGVQGGDAPASFVVFPHFVEALFLIALRAYSSSGRLLPTASDRVATLVTWMRASPTLGRLQAQARAKGRGFAGRDLSPAELMGGPRALQRVKRQGGAPRPSIFASLLDPTAPEQRRADLKATPSLARMVIDDPDADIDAAEAAGAAPGTLWPG